MFTFDQGRFHQKLLRRYFKLQKQVFVVASLWHQFAANYHLRAKSTSRSEDYLAITHQEMHYGNFTNVAMPSGIWVKIGKISFQITFIEDWSYQYRKGNPWYSSLIDSFLDHLFFVNRFTSLHSSYKSKNRNKEFYCFLSWSSISYEKNITLLYTVI